MGAREVGATVERLLGTAIPGFKPGVRGPATVGRADLLASVDGRQVVIDVKSVAAPVVEDVLARLSMGALQAQRLADDLGGLPLAAVLVPSLGRKTTRAAIDFMASYLPRVGWALVDPAGNARVFAPELGLDIDHQVVRVEPAQSGRSSVRLFSDLNRWLLKILLLAEAPAGLWGGPRQPILSSRELGRVAGVSPEMVRRFVNAFEKQDLLRQSPHSLRVVRRSALLDLWRADEALSVRHAVPVRRVLGGGGALRELSELPDFRDLATVAGFEACRLLGLLHVPISSRVEVHVVVSIPEALRRFGLEECSRADADLWLLPTRYSRSIREGGVLRGGLRVADVFQAALDVLHHPGRGQEQSEYLLKEVLRLEGGE